MNICSNKKDNIEINSNCNNRCFNSDIIDVNKPYKIKDYNSCIEYTKNIFINDLNYTLDKVESICNEEDGFETQIKKQDKKKKEGDKKDGKGKNKKDKQG